MVYDSPVTTGKISIDNQSVHNCAFGGPERKILYITAKTAVYSVKTVVGGRSTTGIVTGVNNHMIKKSRSQINDHNNSSYMKIFSLNGRNIGTYKLSKDISYSNEKIFNIPASIKNSIPSGTYFIQMDKGHSVEKQLFTISN